jgi:BirA family biotin operon repressor/biotin-[acetyl-CoA-carboxylase] ligase
MALARERGLSAAPQWREEVSSTQDVVKGWGRQGRPAGLSLVADRQMAGRGRLGRTWISAPEASVQLSVLLRPKLSARRLPWVSLAVGVAVHEVVASPAVWLKWPNDLLDVRGRKIAGVLAEVEMSGGVVDAVVVGVGINVSASPEEMPLAGCLRDIGADRPREELAVALVAAILRRVQQVASEPAALQRAWEEACGMWGQRARVGNVEGVVVGLAESGGLRLERDDGTCQVVMAGDVDMVSVEHR